MTIDDASVSSRERRCRRRGSLVGGILAACLLVAACGGDDSASTDRSGGATGAGAVDQEAVIDDGFVEETSVLDIEITRRWFAPRHLMAPPSPVQFRITNTDDEPRWLEILGHHSGELQPGETVVLDLGILDIGVYEMVSETAAGARMLGELHILWFAIPGPLPDPPGGGVH